MIQDIYEEFIVQENKINWEDIKIWYRDITAPEQWEDPVSVGLDTETLYGYVKLITDSFHRSLLLEDESPDELLKFLCYKPYRDTLNFWYNIQYDFDSICKHLPVENIEELIETGESFYGKYKIKYIPKKFFTIAHSKHAYTFYDLAQFYEMSLENAAYKYLGGVKNPDHLDRKLIGISPQYWEDNRDAIIKYCLIDSKLTAGLGDFLVKTFRDDIDFSPQRYISKASISKQYFRTYTTIPNIASVSEEAMYYAFNSYYGGRFEIIEKGQIGFCSLIDINSAYPYEISNLVDVSKGRWRMVFDWSPDATYGFYKALVKVPINHINPLPFRLRDTPTICYPAGQWITFLTLQEILAYQDFMDVQIIRGYEYYPKVFRYPFKEAIDTLYKKKQNSSKKDFKYSLYKIIMNSLYGCFYEKIKKPDGTYKAGTLFNPIYASIITANTRIQEFKEAQKYGNRVIAFATDSLLIRGEVDKSEYTTDELGKFSFDMEGETNVIRAGIYRINDKMKSRGIKRPVAKKIYEEDGKPIRSLVAPNPLYKDREIEEERLKHPVKYFDLYHYIEKQPERTLYEILSYRPVHLKEAMIKTKYSQKDINLFKPDIYKIDLNVDFKRNWRSEWKRGGDIFHSSIKSFPLVFFDKSDFE
jgi:hypothetical protein